MEWNGTFLGEFDKNIIICEKTIETIRYVELNIDDKYFTCIIKQSKDLFPCIVDELKHISNLSLKIGTHSLKIGSKLYIIYRPGIKDKFPVYEYTLADIENFSDVNMITNILLANPIFIQEIKKIFTFRELIGLTCNYDSSIRIRPYYNTYLPLSFREVSTDITKDIIKGLPNTALRKWFREDDMAKMVKNLLKIYDENTVNVKMFELTNKINEVMERIDKNYIWMVGCIIERIRTYLTIDDSIVEW